MNFRKVFLVVTLAILTWSGGASAALDRIEEALELDAGQLRLPTYATDRITIKPCDTCESQGFQITGNTTYRLGGRTMELDTFVQEMSLSRNKKGQLVTVFYLPETHEVTRIVVTAGA